MVTKADIPFYVYSPPGDVYTNELTPVSAIPKRSDKLTFPSFVDSATEYQPDKVLWDFGDGTTSTSLSATHVYKWPGVYTVKLKIIDKTGNIVESQQTENIQVKDFLPTSYAIINPSDVYNIPAGKPSNPIQINYTTSWQSFDPEHRVTPQTPSGYQHWMPNQDSPGFWMDGEYHPGTVSTYTREDYINTCGGDPLPVPPTVDISPVFPFNLYVSGSGDEPINEQQYTRDKYGHLLPRWYFTSTDFPTIPLFQNVISSSRRDLLTQEENHPNTYEKLYYASDGSNYLQVSPDTDGAVFVGIRGNVSVNYTPSTPVNYTTRDLPQLFSASIEMSKIMDPEIFRNHNQQYLNYNNPEAMLLFNIKCRVNDTKKINISTTGVPEMSIGNNKWVNSDIHYTLTFGDADNNNILASTSTSPWNVKLVDESGNDLLNQYTNTITNTQSNYLQGHITFDNEIDTSLNVQLSANTYVDQLSGFEYDTTRGFFSNRDTTGAPGQLYSALLKDQLDYTNESLTNNIETSINLEQKNIITSGVIESVTVSDPGAGYTIPPSIIFNTTTGQGAQVTVSLKDGGIDSIDVINQGIGYKSTDYITIVGEPNSRPPATISLNIIDNNKCNIISTIINDPETGTHPVSIETGDINRVLQFNSSGEIANLKTINKITGLETLPSDLNIKTMSINSNNDIILHSMEDNSVITLSYSLELLDRYVHTNTILGIETTENNEIVLAETGSINILNSSTFQPITIPELVNVQDIQVYDNYIYISTTNNFLKIDITNRSYVVKDLIFKKFIVNHNHNVFYINTAGDTLGWLNEELEAVSSLSFSGSNLCSISFDTRHFVWLLDDNNKNIIFVDTVDVDWSTITTSTGAFDYKKIISRVYPPLKDYTGVQTLETSGDWLGYKWLLKYGYIKQQTKLVTGTSNMFTINPREGLYNIRKINEDHDQSYHIRSYALQPWLQGQEKLWSNYIAPIIGDRDSDPMSLGKRVHEKIANFTINFSDPDCCTIDNILSNSQMYSIDIQQYSTTYPPSLQRILDICTIPYKKLLGEFDKSSKYFNQYDLYTTPDLRLNLGEEIDLRTYTLTAGTKIVAYELFSKEYKLINVTTALSGDIENNNIINSGDIIPTASSANYYLENYSGKYTTSIYPISAYNAAWRWELILPSNVEGLEVQNYYKFFTHNATSSNTIAIDNIINWSDPQNTLVPEISSYNEWSRDDGTMSNMIEHQLRTGLQLFNN